jgi:uncharacterized membrane protein YphA (DoxX/SURF4 family)
MIDINNSIRDGIPHAPGGGDALAERGVPFGLLPTIVMSGRILECFAGIALALGVFPRRAALALFAFLVPATFVSHSFWLAAGTPAFQGQLINFCKNSAIWGGLLFIAATRRQPPLWPRNTVAQRATE